jgi:hypothetical protein
MTWCLRCKVFGWLARMNLQLSLNPRLPLQTRLRHATHYGWLSRELDKHRAHAGHR